MGIRDNPYLSQIMGAIDMISADTAREREIQRRQKLFEWQQNTIFNRQRMLEEEKAKSRTEQQKAKSQYEYWKTLAQDENVDPQTRKMAYQKMGEVVGMLSPEIGFQEKEQKYRLDPNVAKYFNLDPNIEWDPKTYQAINVRYRQLTKPGTGGASNEKNDPVLKRLGEFEKRAIERYNRGAPKMVMKTDQFGRQYQDMGREAIDDQMYTSYLNQIEMLRDKRLSGNWTEEDEKQLKMLEPFDLYFQKARRLKKTMQEEGTTPQPVHQPTRDDPFGIRDLIE